MRLPLVFRRKRRDERAILAKVEREMALAEYREAKRRRDTRRIKAALDRLTRATNECLALKV